jgi:hypothetical protein
MPASQASGSETERLWLITDHVLVLLVVWVFFFEKGNLFLPLLVVWYDISWLILLVPKSNSI